MTTAELAEWLRESRSAAFGVVIHVGDRLVPWNGGEDLLGEGWHAYLTAGAPCEPIWRGRQLAVGEMGWASVDLHPPPTDTLYMTQAGAKSDWYELADGHVYENPTSIRVFEEVWKRWRRHLTPGVTLRARDGGPSRRARGVSLSIGARTWAAAGGKLAQRGSENVIYEIDPVVDPKRR